MHKAKRTPIKISHPSGGPQTYNGPRGGGSSDIEGALNELQAATVERLDGIDRTIGEIQNATDSLIQLTGRMSAAPCGGSVQEDRIYTRLNAFNILNRTRDSRAADLAAHEFWAYEQAFASYCRFGQKALDDSEIRAALSVGSDPDGGYMVIPDFEPDIKERLFRSSPMRSVASVISVNSGELVGIVETEEAGSGWVGETESRPETASGKLQEYSINAEELYAMPTVTQRLLDDASYDVDSFVLRKIEKRFARAENTAFVTGNGVKKPRGFLDYGAAAVTTADDSSPARPWGKLQYVASGAAGDFPAVSGVAAAKDFGALYDLRAALNAEYRANAHWAMNSSTEAFLNKLKDADGRPILRESLEADVPNQLLGYPVVIMEDMPDVTSDSFSIAFGDFAEGYQIVEKPGVRVLRDPHTTKGIVKFYAYKRVGGDVVNFDAIKLLKFAAS